MSEPKLGPSSLAGYIQGRRCLARHKKSFIGSGVRYDLLLHQSKDAAINRSTNEYTRELIVNHVSGRLKVAPETPATEFYPLCVNHLSICLKLSKKYSTVSTGKRIYVNSSYRTLSLHTPAAKKKIWRNWLSSPNDWTFIWSKYRTLPPTPMTVATEAWYTGFHPYTLEPVFSAKNSTGKTGSTTILLLV